MSPRLQVYLPMFLFGLTLSLAFALGATVVAAPWFFIEGETTHPLLYLFAKDMVVRRTGFFSAMGLVVTALVFFKPEGLMKKKDAGKKPAEVAAG